jgi:hypothetical protein
MLIATCPVARMGTSDVPPWNRISRASPPDAWSFGAPSSSRLRDSTSGSMLHITTSISASVFGRPAGASFGHPLWKFIIMSRRASGDTIAGNAGTNLPCRWVSCASCGHLHSTTTRATIPISLSIKENSSVWRFHRADILHGALSNKQDNLIRQNALDRPQLRSSDRSDDRTRASAAPLTW